MKNKLIYDKDIVKEMLIQSNLIEDMNMGYAHDDAMKAWKYIVGVPILSLASILRVHELLAQRVNPRIAGKFRDCDVYIGGKRKPFMGKTVLEAVLKNWIYDLDMSLGGDAEEQAKKAHIHFENIHPFEDFNGRVGRILYNWHRLKMGLPIHIIHIGQEQFDYYSWFKKKK